MDSYDGIKAVTGVYIASMGVLHHILFSEECTNFVRVAPYIPWMQDIEAPTVLFPAPTVFTIVTFIVLIPVSFLLPFTEELQEILPNKAGNQLSFRY
jgi:hypothetical protein